MISSFVPLIQSFLPMFPYFLWSVVAAYFVRWCFDLFHYILMR